MSIAIVRDAVLADAARILEIYAYYVQHTAISFEYEVPTLSEFENRMKQTKKKYPYLVVEQDGAIQGYAYAGPFVGRAAYDHSCELTIYLDNAAKKHGFGRKLYEELEKRLQELGIVNLYACIGYPDIEDEYLNKNSAEFHAHLGFQTVGEFRKCGYKFGRWYSMIWMEKIIGPHTFANVQKLSIRKAQPNDIALIHTLVKGLAAYEKRPQDMTATQEQLRYWLFERNAATVLIAQYDQKPIGYALYYPIFGSFSGAGKIHLEDLFLQQEFRGGGFGRYFFAKVAETALSQGYAGMEWSCLDWNAPSIAFYHKLGAAQETGREYFSFSKSDMERVAAVLQQNIFCK